MTSIPKKKPDLHFYRRLLSVFNQNRGQGVSLTRLSRELGLGSKDRPYLRQVLVALPPQAKDMGLSSLRTRKGAMFLFPLALPKE